MDTPCARGTRKHLRGRGLWLCVILGIFAPACGGEPSAPVDPPFSKPEKPLAEPPTNTVGGFSIQIPDEVLAPGEERSVCYIFPLELTGPSQIVGGGVLDVGPGMHHGNITTRPKTGEGVRLCPPDEPGALAGEAADILDGGAVLFGSSTQIVGKEWQSFPPGMGFPIRAGHEIVARMHYLNTSQTALLIAPRYEWFTIDESKVEHLLGPFIWVYKGFQIPPKSALTVTGSCQIPGPMHIVNALPHMHALGRGFTMEFMGGELDGQRFLDSPGYSADGVLAQYRPAIDLSQGEGARFSCTWQNTFDKPIVEGIGDNEMCMLFGYGYPYESTYSAYAVGPDNCLPLALPALD